MDLLQVPDNCFGSLGTQTRGNCTKNRYSSCLVTGALAASVNTPIVFAWNPRVQTKKMFGTEVLRSFNWAQEPYLFFLQAPTCLYW